MAAKKNPKRVAAGKKAWRNRGKGRSRSGGRRNNNRRKPIQRGVAGKVGAFILGVAPPAIAGLEAAGAAMAQKKSKNLSALGTVELGFYRFINNLSNGFIGVSALTDMPIPTATGGSVRTGQNTGVPKGSLLTVAGTGLILMGFDWAASKLAGGRPVKIPMTNYNAIGGS